MASPPILDLDTLLAPIDGDNPAGPDLRQDPSPISVYFKIKDARSAARAAERNIEAGEESGGLLPEWRTILDTAPKVIAGQAKDLEIAAWLVEALLRAHGFAGLRDGFRLVRGLVEGFWDNLYPTPDEDGIATRVAPLAGLNGEGADGTLIQPIRKVPITEGSDPGPFAFWQFEQASELLKLGDETKVEQRIAAGAITMESFEGSAKRSTPGFYVTLLADLREALEEWSKLGAALDEKAGQDGPPTSTVRNTLQAVLDCVTAVSRDIIPPEVSPEAEGEAEATGAEAAAGDGATPARRAAAAGAIETRDDAFRTLLKVAEYFRRTEPQSPVSYVIEDAVRRARLPLHELVAELIPDADARRLFFVNAGIRPPEEGG